ncbi:M1 family metallopeptidase [Mucilaginibacter sp. PAMB04274]|uniref:M1 family metallopeptidase n=1 Tax=Mucilaginibacter sp. PAMB04274 TaxID=3138568 RepID=UPI0031F62F28
MKDRNITNYMLSLFSLIRLSFLLNILLFTAFYANGKTQYSSSVRTELVLSDTVTEQSWWDVTHYRIAVTPDYRQKSISGENHIAFLAKHAGASLQVDLQQPMKITRVVWNNRDVLFKRKNEGAYIISFPKVIKAGEKHTIIIQFEGKPQEALNPPVDNGWIWTKDEKGRPWISVACEGSGASIWLPCKDVLADEPDNGILFDITVPDTLVAVANGRFKRRISNNGTATYTWVVKSPINSYNIVPYVGHYVTWHKQYAGLNKLLDCDFWVLDYNLNRGKEHFKQTDTMLRAFEYWLGPYPFYADSYKLVEAPLPGMEHQSAVAYGNGFQNGYRGKDFISATGWGLKWDFMLVHESGHEWFGNSITAATYGDTWIHEGFTKYLETLYTDFVFGREAGNEYALGTWKRIKNDSPILGTNTSDKYYKGSAMLHTIRQLVGDSVFRGWLHEINRKFYHQVINTGQILKLLNGYTKKDFSKVFAQYLQTTKIPVLEYYFQAGKLHYRWSGCVDGFDMPLKISFDPSNVTVINPTTQWQTLTVTNATGRLMVDRNFLIKVTEVTASN